MAKSASPRVSGSPCGCGVTSRRRDDKPSASRPYETVGYVISGRAELTVGGETVTLELGDSWLVPAEAEHTYTILEEFTAVEATAPPAA